MLTAGGSHRFLTEMIPDTCRMVDRLSAEDRPVFVIEATCAAGFHSTRHSHPRGQLSYARDGLMTVVAEDCTLIVPAGHAVWIPPAIEHQAHSVENLRVLSAYASPDAWPDMPVRPKVFGVSPLLEPLLTRLIAAQLRRETGPATEALLVLLQDEVRAGQSFDLGVPMPRDRRLRRVCEAVLTGGPGGLSKEDLARIGNLSSRTMTRLFRSELGMTFSEWSQRALVVAAVGRLSQGDPVALVAADLGYDSPSAFSAMFRRRIGRRPSDLAHRPG